MSQVSHYHTIRGTLTMRDRKASISIQLDTDGDISGKLVVDLLDKALFLASGSLGTILQPSVWPAYEDER